MGRGKFPQWGRIRNFAGGIGGEVWWLGSLLGGIFPGGRMSKVSTDGGDSPHPLSRENPGRVIDFS